MPDGVEVRQVSLPGTREPPRREYFLAGTAQSQIPAAPQAARRPRITSPVSGSVHALDPDIPLAPHRLPVHYTGSLAGSRPIPDKKPIRAHHDRPQTLPHPGPTHLTHVP